MARRKDWSLIDAQMKARDSLDRQGRFPSPASLPTAPFTQPVGKRAMPKPRPSPDRIAERSGTYSSGVSRRQTYNEMTYGKPDVASLGDPVSPHRKHGDVGPVSHKAQDFMLSGQSRGGTGDWGNPNIPTRDMAVGGPRPDSPSGKHRRQASTQAAYRAADASMFNSNVTPKAAPLKDYKPRGKTVKDKNIQAFY